jgi:glyoxylase-like metal-dependent hydrolase (beta-lactamase superfamily II)
MKGTNQPVVSVIKDVPVDGLVVVPCRPNGPRGIVKAFLLYDDASVVLVDAGFSDADADLIVAALRRIGRTPADLSLCLVTHHHLDHVGGLKKLLAQASFPVLSHAREVEPILATCGVRVARTVSDGDCLPEGGGVRIVQMPGHTPGSIAVYHEASRSLLAGDAIFSAGEWLIISPAYLCEDPGQARSSVEHLLGLNLDIERVLVAHGDDVYSGVPDQLSKMLMNSRAEWAS